MQSQRRVLTLQKFVKVINKELSKGRSARLLQRVDELLDFSWHTTADRNTCKNPRHTHAVRVMLWAEHWNRKQALLIIWSTENMQHASEKLKGALWSEKLLLEGWKLRKQHRAKKMCFPVSSAWLWRDASKSPICSSRGVTWTDSLTGHFSKAAVQFELTFSLKFLFLIGIFIDGFQQRAGGATSLTRTWEASLTVARLHALRIAVLLRVPGNGSHVGHVVALGVGMGRVGRVACHIRRGWVVLCSRQTGTNTAWWLTVSMMGSYKTTVPLSCHIPATNTCGISNKDVWLWRQGLQQKS